MLCIIACTPNLSLSNHQFHYLMHSIIGSLHTVGAVSVAILAYANETAFVTSAVRAVLTTRNNVDVHLVIKAGVSTGKNC